jgi:hypothetical protein
MGALPRVEAPLLTYLAERAPQVLRRGLNELRQGGHGDERAAVAGLCRCEPDW